MAGFKRTKEIVENAHGQGQMWYNTFTKVPAITTTQGFWFDMSLAPGNPKPNYYATAELTSEVLDGKFGIYHGTDVSPKKKFLQRFCVFSNNSGFAPAQLMLLDYLLYYPLVDMDSTDEQFMTNSKPLPRYETGEGVQAMIVATNPFVGGASFTIKYTNSDGESGKISIVAVSNTSTNIGTILTSGTTATQKNMFIPLCPGCKGIRSIESVTFYSPNGGLATIVLVKPIATLVLNETTAMTEIDFAFDRPSLPEIKDGAYLNLICSPNGNSAGQRLLGEILTIWN